ncbi:MAG: MlaD family protein [Acidimicrobiales bacterium]
MKIRRFLVRLGPKAITDWNHKRIGAVTIALVVLVVAGALMLTSNVFASGYTVGARFSNAVGLADGDQVLLAGVAVGKVQSVEVVGNHVQAKLRINSGVKLPSDTSASIAVQSLLGLIGVNLTPGGNWTHLLSNNSLISNTSVPFEYFQIQNASGKLLSATNARALGQVVSDLQAVTSGDRSQIKQVIDGLSKATTAIDQHRGAASQLINAAQALSATLASKDHQLATVIQDLDVVMKGLAQRSGQLGQLIDQTEQVALQTSSLIGRNQPRLQEMLTSLHGALAVIGQHQIDIARSVAFAASAITGFASVGKSGVANTPWANIYTNLVASSVGDEILGPCGALDQVLNIALGPDPRSCSNRTGPPVGGSSSAPASPTSASAAALVTPLIGGKP